MKFIVKAIKGLLWLIERTAHRLRTGEWSIEPGIDSRPAKHWRGF